MSFSIDWVLINELAVGKGPKTSDDLAELKKLNINSILSLCSEDECKPAPEMEKIFCCKRIILPDHKARRDPNIEEINIALEALNYLISKGPTFVHCVASIERSPLICMSYLIKKCNLTPLEALDYLMEVHPISNPLPGQFAILKKLK